MQLTNIMAHAISSPEFVKDPKTGQLQRAPRRVWFLPPGLTEEGAVVPLPQECDEAEVKAWETVDSFKHMLDSGKILKGKIPGKEATIKHEMQSRSQYLQSIQAGRSEERRAAKGQAVTALIGEPNLHKAIVRPGEG